MPPPLEQIPGAPLLSRHADAVLVGRGRNGDRDPLLHDRPVARA